LSTFGQSLAWCREITEVTDEMIEDSICRARLSYVMRKNIAEWDNEIKKKFHGNLRRFQTSASQTGQRKRSAGLTCTTGAATRPPQSWN
ncbi:MAG: hypothetical protein II687_08705, partial [Selenomonadaceae bacterium]|nr:hypothetical protein [Selenomonadaceae bacterium]